MKKIGILIGCILLLEVLKYGIIKEYNAYMSEPLLLLSLDKPISYDKLIQKEIYEKYSIGGTYCRWSEIKEDTSQKIWLVGSNSFYDDYNKLSYIEGGFYREDSVRLGSNLGVISDKLAISLFGSIHAVGNWCEIEGQRYLIVGVYKKPVDIRFFCEDGKERVYVPITSAVMKKEGIDRLYCYVSDPLRRADLFSYYELSESNVSTYESGEATRQLRSWSKLTLLIFSIILIHKAIQKSKQKNKQAILYWLVGGIGGVIVCNGFYISPDALPCDDLLAPSAYLSYFCNMHYLKNRLQTEGETLGLGIYWVIRNIVLFCDIFQLILLEKIRRLWNRINKAIYIKR